MSGKRTRFRLGTPSPGSFGLVLIVKFAHVGKGRNKLNLGNLLLRIRPSAVAPFLSGLNPKA